jgi:hypothetical protein
MAKDDYVEVTATVGSDPVTWTIRAEKQGRNVDTAWEKDGNMQWFVIQEKTRGGTVVRENRCNAAAIIALTIVKKEV